MSEKHMSAEEAMAAAGRLTQDIRFSGASNTNTRRMNVGYTMQKLGVETLTVLTGPDDQRERLRMTLKLLKEARDREIGIGFDDPAWEQRFAQVLLVDAYDAKTDVGAVVDEIAELAREALTAAEK